MARHEDYNVPKVQKVRKGRTKTKPKSETDLTPAAQQRFDHAMRLVNEGFAVFPLKRGSKYPFKGEGVSVASRDRDVIFRWFQSRKHMNYGVAANNGPIIDVDAKHGQPGLQSWNEIVEQHGPFPKSLKVASPNGGFHVYFKGYESGQSPLAAGIDVRGVNGYVLGPGCSVKGKTYEIIEDAPVAPLPDALKPLFNRARSRDADRTPLCELDTDQAIDRGRSYLRSLRETHDGVRNNTAFKVACQLKDFGLSVEWMLELMREDWSERCSPPLSDWELEKVCNSAYINGRNAPGAASPEADFADLPEPLNAFDGAPPKPSKDKPNKLLEFLSDVTVDDIVAHSNNALVKGILHPQDTVILYGPSTAGKTFVALDLAHHIALGLPWNGWKVKQAPVLYISLEGNLGFRRRMYVVGQKLGNAGSMFARLVPDISLANGERGNDGVKEIVRACDQLKQMNETGVGLVVIDTKARATAGDDENDAGALMVYLNDRVQRIADKTGAAVLTVHHPNKKGEERGSSALKPSCDVQMRIDRKNANNNDAQLANRRSLHLEKNKEGEERKLFEFDLDVQFIARDDDDFEITSCTVQKFNASETSAADAQRRKDCEAYVLQQMTAMIQNGVRMSPKSRARNSAANKLYNAQKTGLTDYTKEELSVAVEALTGTVFVEEEYKKLGHIHYQFALNPDLIAVGAGSSCDDI